MKKVVLLLIAFATSVIVNAQIVKNLEYPKFHFGIRAAMTVNTQSYDGFPSSSKSNKSYKTGVESMLFASGGLAADFRLAPIPIYLETGVYYVNRGAETVYNNKSNTVDSDHTIMVPILASYHLYFTKDMALQPFTGPYVEYGFDSETVNYGVRAGIGFNYRRLYVNTGYDYGFNKIKGYNNAEYTNGTAFMTIGFNFVGSY